MSGAKVRGPMGYDRVPFIGNHGQGQGVNMQREEVPMRDQRPQTGDKGTGQGVQMQRKEVQSTGRLSSPFPYY